MLAAGGRDTGVGPAKSLTGVLGHTTAWGIECQIELKGTAHTIIAVHIGASVKVQSSFLGTPDENSASIYLSLRIEVLTQ